jgi:hypothetical protein
MGKGARQQQCNLQEQQGFMSAKLRSSITMRCSHRWSPSWEEGVREREMAAAMMTAQGTRTVDPEGRAPAASLAGCARSTNCMATYRTTSGCPPSVHLVMGGDNQQYSLSEWERHLALRGMPSAEARQAGRVVALDQPQTNRSSMEGTCKGCPKADDGSRNLDSIAGVHVIIIK